MVSYMKTLDNRIDNFDHFTGYESELEKGLKKVGI